MIAACDAQGGRRALIGLFADFHRVDQLIRREVEALGVRPH